MGQSYPMSMEGSLAAAEKGCCDRGQPPGTRSVHVSLPGSLATWLQMLGKAGQEAEKSRGLFQELCEQPGAREAALDRLTGYRVTPTKWVHFGNS